MQVSPRISKAAAATWQWIYGLRRHNALFALVAGTAALIAVWQTAGNDESNRLYMLRWYLVDLNNLAREATRPEASQLCAPEVGCLGSLTLKQSYFDQFELLTLNAYHLAEELDELETEKMTIADALYKCGKLDESILYANELAESDDYSIRFRAELLLAQIYYFQGEPDNGERHIKLALEIVEEPRNEIPKVEQGILHAQAYLTSGRMKVAMGKAEDSVSDQKLAFESLSKLPRTNRVTQLTDTLQTLIAADQHQIPVPPVMKVGLGKTAAVLE